MLRRKFLKCKHFEGNFSKIKKYFKSKHLGTDFPSYFYRGILIVFFGYIPETGN